MGEVRLDFRPIVITNCEFFDDVAINISNSYCSCFFVALEQSALKFQLPDTIQAAYADARDEAYGETGLALETFPIAPPLTWEEAMEQPIYLDP